jgi:predicted metal-dependent HD superfamily phosphohydrolase
MTVGTWHRSENVAFNAVSCATVPISILGAEPSRYDEFEHDVRREYRWVPGIVYRPKRAAILQSFLDRPRICQFEPVFERFERKARTNVSGAIQALIGRS